MFTLSNVESNVNLHVSNKFKLKPVKFFTKKKNLNRFENKGICGIVLNCTSPNTNTKSITNSLNQYKKQKTSYYQPKSYHRWFLCADAMNPPHTFVIVTLTFQQTAEFLKHVHEDSTFMGMPFYIVEPNLSTSRVGDYLQVLEYNGQPMIPLKHNTKFLKKPSPVDLPRGGDQTFFFVLEGVQLTLTRMKYNTNTCTGYQCDRHWGKDGCVCCHSSMGNALVYEFDFEIPVNKEQFNATMHVATLKSFKTMSVFFRNLIEYTHETTPGKEEMFLLRRRSQVRRLLDFINENGGWKVIGWCKRGLLTFEGEAGKVENTNVNLNLTSVQPQEEKILQESLFKGIQIRVDFDLLDDELPNLSQEIESASSDDDSTSTSNSKLSDKEEDEGQDMEDEEDDGDRGDKNNMEDNGDAEEDSNLHSNSDDV